jgi:hypothetical protein
MNLEKAVEPQKSAKGTKYQTFAAPSDITQRVLARRIRIFFFLRFLRLFAAIQSPFLGL